MQFSWWIPGNKWAITVGSVSKTKKTEKKKNFMAPFYG